MVISVAMGGTAGDGGGGFNSDSYDNLDDGDSDGGDIYGISSGGNDDDDGEICDSGNKKSGDVLVVMITVSI